MYATPFDKQAASVLRERDVDAAARAWCDEHADDVCAMELLFSPKRASSVVAVVERALSYHPVLRGMVMVASARTSEPRIEDVWPFLAIWPVRDEPSRYVEALVAWGERRAVHGEDCNVWPWSAARHVAEWPELAYGVVAALRATKGACRGCGNQRHETADRYAAKLALLRLGSMSRADADEAALECLGADVMKDVELWPLLLRAASRGACPLRLLDAARERVGGSRNPDERAGAIRLLLASTSDEDNEEAIARLARWIDAPDLYVDVVVLDQALREACCGPSWGRKKLPKKLLPLVRALWRRENRTKMALLRRTFDPVEDAGSWERVRECVAEHLLATAIDARGERTLRLRALEAILALQPGGDRSVMHALGKVNGDALVSARAKEVRTALSRLPKHARLSDGELAIDDAWAAFFGSS